MRKRRKECEKLLSRLNRKLRSIGNFSKMGENVEREVSCLALVVHSFVAKLLSAQRFLLISIPIMFLCWRPKKINLKWRLGLSKKRMRRKETRNSWYFRQKTSFYRELFWDGRKGKKQEVSVLFVAVVHSSVAKLLPSNASYEFILKPLMHYFERQKNVIAVERNPKRWKARLKGMRRKLKCRFLFVSKLRSTRRSW